MAASQELNFLTTLLPLATILFIIAIGVILLNQHFRKNLYMQMLKQEELKTLHHQELLKSSIEVQEKERKRIAQDMHDELGAVLSIARMQLVQLEQQQHDQKEIGTALKQVRHTTETVLASMRRLSHELMPPQLEAFGLGKTLKTVCDQLTDTNKISIHLSLPDELPRFSNTIELSLYRICMEMIHNTIKHADAKSICIDLVQQHSEIHLIYSDDGKGLPEENGLQGLGFKSMQARANAIGGAIEIGNGKNGGFQAFIKVPI